MNIKELIEILSQFDPETRVIVAGYETGFDDISEVKEMSIVLNVYEAWYSGSHEGLDELDEKDKEELQNNPQVKAIFLEGKKRLDNVPIKNIPMKVKSLIEVLSQFLPETRVVVSGYENGFNDISKIEEMSIILNVYKEWYDGSHEKYEEYKEKLQNKPQVRAIFLGGQNPLDDSYPNDNYWR